eukprot:SAG25_NODE_9626_length_365_cov_0.533835_1_plen_56_part_01
MLAERAATDRHITVGILYVPTHAHPRTTRTSDGGDVRVSSISVLSSRDGASVSAAL